MGTYGGIDITGECWGIDTSMAGILTDDQLVRMLNTALPNGVKPTVLCGYVPLSGNKASTWDMTRSRLYAAMDIGWKVWLVQHCRAGSWHASPELGGDDGKMAADYAASIDYDPSSHLAMDQESLANSGPIVAGHVNNWCDAVPTPQVYEGFDPGLNPDQEYHLLKVTSYWGAFGPWKVSVRGVVARQGLQITHCGVGVDPDHIKPDNLGGCLRAMGRLDLAAGG